MKLNKKQWHIVITWLSVFLLNSCQKEDDLIDNSLRGNPKFNEQNFNDLLKTKIFENAFTIYNKKKAVFKDWI